MTVAYRLVLSVCRLSHMDCVVHCGLVMDDCSRCVLRLTVCYVGLLGECALLSCAIVCLLLGRCQRALISGQ